MNAKKKYLKELLRYIPSGAQTMSKNPTQFVVGVTPVAIRKAKGAYCWDIEGDKYLDLILALGPIILGYADKRVDRAVKRQIDKGVIYSLPSEHELTLAKLLKECVPCAEMSRFVLNGNDATSGAIRLARHITKRDHVAKCGYHGWQDWSICTKEGRNTGVPEVIKTMTHDFVYNDIASLEKIFAAYPGKIAAVILEPVSTEAPRDKFLERVKELAHRNGAILIFDEMVTGFHWALGGASEFFGVTPDIGCFGKAVANGYPLSMICGKAEYMKRMDEVFVSMTFCGSVPSLVAAITTLRILKAGKKKIYGHIHKMGNYLIDQGNTTAKKHAAPFTFVGYGPHPVMKINISDDYLSRVVKTYMYQEFNKAGILMSSAMLVGYMHTQAHMDEMLKVFDGVCARIKEVNGDYKKLEARLLGDVCVPRTVRQVQ